MLLRLLLALLVQAPIVLTCVGNEGVLIEGGGRKVLIDGLFQYYGPAYALPDSATRTRLIQAQSPFDGIDVLLFTHLHGDHFHPIPTAAHMHSNRQAQLVASPMTIDSLRPRITDFEARIIPRNNANGTHTRDTINGVVVETIGIPHGYRPNLQHLGFIVEMNGKRVLHVGDTDVEESVMQRLRLDTARVDVALIPSWLITDAKQRAIIQRAECRERMARSDHLQPSGHEFSDSLAAYDE